MAAVRPEFRVDVYVPGPDDPVLGRRRCAVPGCDRSAVATARAVHAHASRLAQPRVARTWRSSWPIPARRCTGRRALAACTVPGCRYGISAGTGCACRHRDRWDRAGQPGPGGLGRA